MTTTPSPALPDPQQANRIGAWPVITAVIALACVGVWLVQVALGVPWFSPTPDQLISWGGSLAARTLTGEYWRLVTSMFLHAGLLHLLANMYMLASVGPRAEREFGHVGMLVIYAVGGLFGGLCSAWWQGLNMVKSVPRMTAFGVANQEQISLVVSVGASGAIMALCGALLVSRGVRTELPAQTERQDDDQGFNKALWQVVGINVVIGFIAPGVDQAVHLGGLLSGMLLAVACGSRRSHSSPIAKHGRVLASALVGVAVVWAVLGVSSNDRLVSVRTELDAGAVAEQAETQKRFQLEQLEKQAEAERAGLPAPVSVEVAQGQVISFGSSGVAMALSDDERLAYVVDNKKNQLSVLDLASGTVLSRVTGPVVPPVTACGELFCQGRGASFVALLSGRNLALVASMHQDAIDVLDLASSKIVKTIPVGKFPRDIAVSSDQSRAYVQNTLSNSVSVVDLKQWKVIKTLALKKDASLDPARPLAVWLSVDERRLFVLNRPDREVVVFDVASLEQVDNRIPHYQFEHARRHPSIAGSILGLRHDQLFVRPEENLERSSAYYELCNSMKGTAFDAARTTSGLDLVAVATPADSLIRIANLQSHVTLGSYPAPGRVSQLRFSKNGAKLFALGEAGVLSIIDPQKRIQPDVELDLLCKG